MTAALPLPQKLALLDLMTTAQQAPEQVRAEALDLAATHQVATPAEVERALAKLKPVARAYAWDRPQTQVELFARQAERQRLQQEWEKHHPRARWYHRIGFENGAILSIGAMVPATLGSALFWFKIKETFGLEGGDLLFAAFAVTTLALIVSPAIIFGTLHARYHLQGGGSDRENAQEDREHPVSPTPEQAARWLAYEEVATQARAWINSEAGLMAEDVRLLDARVEALNRATQSDRNARLLAQLRTGSAA